jgi:hypothetical protein
VLEIKSCGQKSWDWIAGGGPKKYAAHGADEKHIQQVQLYMYMTGLSYAVIIYENKNTQERAYYTIKRDNELINNHLLPKVDYINSHVAEGTLPARDPKYKIKAGKVPFDCSFCEYRQVCEEEERRFSLGQSVDLIALGKELIACEVPADPSASH